MEFWGKVINFFGAEMERPTSYGWFHLMFAAIVVLATVLVCVFLKNVNEKTFRIILLACWITMVLFEIYKQLNYSFSYDAEQNKILFEYEWYAFPFQLCSTPLYVLPFIVFLPKGHVRDAMMAFMAFFSFFGGFVTFVYPEQVFIQTIGINIQTMVHHGLQILLGIYISVYTRKKFGILYYLKGSIVFTALMGIALIMNISVYNVLEKSGLDMTLGINRFNMFYIGPKFPCSLPLLSSIYPSVPPLVFVLIYLFGFLTIGIIIFGIIYGIISLVRLIKKLAGRPCGA